MKKNKIILILITIIIFGGFLRLWRLDKYPVGLTPDEAAQGYTAYSLLKTGKDEWGKQWPINLRSYGDFKPPLQTYLMIPSIKLFGLSKFAVRFPNALLGTLGILGVFLLTSIHFKNKTIGLLSTFLLAFSRWHWPLSRGAFEANLTVFFISFGLYLLIISYSSDGGPKGLLRGGTSQILAAVFLGLNMFSYHSAKLVTPIIIFLFITKKLQNAEGSMPKEIRNYISQNSKFVLLYSIFFVIAFSTFFSGGQSRGLDIAIFNPTDKWQVVKDARWWAVQRGVPDVLARLVHNKATYTISKFFENYLGYFSPQFLFLEGPAEATYGMIPGYGVLWLWQLPVILFGIYWLIKNKPKFKSAIAELILIILIAPLPVALTKGKRMANRAAVMMPFVQMLCAWSLYKLMSLRVTHRKLTQATIWCQHSSWQAGGQASYGLKRIKFLFLISISFIFLFGVFHFSEVYFVQSPRLVAEPMLYGRCEAVKYVQKNYSQVDQIIISRKLSEPQAYAMFCGQYPPEKAQQETNSWLEYENQSLSFVDQLGEYRLGKYLFKEINWASDSEKENSVLIGPPREFPYNVKPDKIIKYPNEKAAIFIVQV